MTTATAKSTPSVKSNEIADQCYCSKARNFDDVEIQCWTCARWFHKTCVEIDTGPLVRFMVNYQFVCKKCSLNNQESFVKKQASFHQLCLTALANLTADQRNELTAAQRQFFSRDRDMIPFIEKYWEAMTNAPRRTKSTWHATVSRSMTREDVFVTRLEGAETCYGLRDTSLEKIGPYNENVKLVLGPSRVNESSRTAGPSALLDPSGDRSIGAASSAPNATTNGKSSSSSSSSAASSSSANGGGSSSSSSTKRGSKRKATNDGSSSAGSSAVNGSGLVSAGASGLASSQLGNAANSRRKGVNDLSRLEKMVPTCYPSDHPFNKDSYRYYLVEPDPHSPLRQKFEETELWAGKPLPGYLYRLFLESRVAFALHDRAPQLKVSDDRMCVTGDKGYSMIRATHGVSHGAWYFELTVRDKPNASSALRVGWAQELGNLQAPCGYDKFSYSWRSRKGTKFHDSIGKTYSRLVEAENDASGGFGAGDVLGFYIHLPQVDGAAQLVPADRKQLTLVKFKNHLYYEEKDNVAAAEKALTPLPGSKIVFFKNGVCQGVAFSDIYLGCYYPAVSLYKNSSVVANFGPDFRYPPVEPEYSAARPVSDLAQEKFVEHTLADLLYNVSNDASSLL